MPGRFVYLDNDDEPEIAITRKNTSTGVEEAAAGLTLTVHLSLTKDGAAINADLTRTASERASKPGTYFAIMDGDKLRSHVAGSAGKVLQYVWIAGDDIKANEAVLIIAARPT